MHPRIPHPKIGDPGHIKGVRTVATFEFTKGIVVLLAGLGVFTMRHKDIWGVAESLLEFFHANPHHHFVGIFIDLVYKVSDIRLWKIATVAAVYVILRFVEAYGLWYVRPWAEWLAIASGSIYIPFEVADLLRRPDIFRVLILVINVGVVVYMLMLRLEAAKKHHAARAYP
ncbi:MAG TPA: DUF2127 domain-containing protein [Terriglobales bacterium]|jgi:uncharacterized membrane protein (DUF2068 family)|nr:DUF2127 domain-containing protein [Terriglobales bacterium]